MKRKCQCFLEVKEMDGAMWYDETGEEAKTQDPVWGRPRPDGGGEQDGDQE